MFDHQHLSSIGEPRAPSVYIYIYSNTLVDGIDNQQTSRHPWHPVDTSGPTCKWSSDKWTLPLGHLWLGRSPPQRAFCGKKHVGTVPMTTYYKTIYGKMYMEYMLVQHITHYMESELRQNNIVIYLQDHERTRAETNATFKCFKSCSMTSSLLTPKAPYAAKALGFPDLSFAAGG